MSERPIGDATDQQLRQAMVDIGEVMPPLPDFDDVVMPTLLLIETETESPTANRIALFAGVLAAAAACVAFVFLATDIGRQDVEPVFAGPTETSAPSTVVEVTTTTTSAKPEERFEANFDFTAAVVKVGETVKFFDSSSGSPVSWNWSFDDGTGAEGPEVTKAWEQEGFWTVDLFVRDADGREASTSAEITVVGPLPPEAEIALMPRQAQAGEAVSFRAFRTPRVDDFVWDFGDGITTVGREAKHTWVAPGTYAITLTVSGAAGSDSITETITITE